jgi:hypothetical protein
VSPVSVDKRQETVGTNLVITYEGDYVKVISEGEKTFAFADRVWKETTSICIEHDCFNVLGLSASTSPMPTWDAFEHADLFEKHGIDNRYRIAWVETSAEALQSTYFIETVLANRGLPGRLFLDADEALQWLLEGG